MNIINERVLKSVKNPLILVDYIDKTLPAAEDQYRNYERVPHLFTIDELETLKKTTVQIRLVLGELNRRARNN